MKHNRIKMNDYTDQTFYVEIKNSKLYIRPFWSSMEIQDLKNAIQDIAEQNNLDISFEKMNIKYDSLYKTIYAFVDIL